MGMQVTARNGGLALDNMGLKTTVINIEKYKEVTERAEVGAYVHGFFLQGAKWELGRGQDQGNLIDMVPKELYPELPVVHVTAVEKAKQSMLGFYESLFTSQRAEVEPMSSRHSSRWSPKRRKPRSSKDITGFSPVLDSSCSQSEH